MDDKLRQVKFTIGSDVVAAFQARCANEGVSMTEEIKRFMQTRQPVREIKTRTLTRPLRRMAVLEIIGLLNGIMEAEANYRDSIPEAFVGRYESADHACDQIAEAIGSLEEAF